MILGLLKPTKGKVLINEIEIENGRIDLLDKIILFSIYRITKKLTVRQNLEVYGRLYDVKNLKTKIEYLSEELRLNNIVDKALENYLQVKKIE